MDLVQKFAYTTGIVNEAIGIETDKIDKDKYKKELSDRGLAGFKQQLIDDLEKWSHIKLNTAVTGQPGSGKSSFINCIRDVQPKAEGAAKTGTTETTTICTPYVHPGKECFIVWDLPGVGTQRFPKAEYLKKVEYDKYDFFIVILKDRFTETDLWLAREVLSQNKKLFFVRSNADTDMSNKKDDDPENFDEKKEIEIIRNDIKYRLKVNGVKDSKVFVISNKLKHRKRFDFGSLNNELLGACDGLKKDAMALSLAAVTEEITADKKRVLQSRIDGVAMLVTWSEEKSEQKSIFQMEIGFYQKQLNIDAATLAENKQLLSFSDKAIQEFSVSFDEQSSQNEIKITTPTTMRENAALLDRFKDVFRWDKKKKLLFIYCQAALKSNLEILYEKSCEIYVNTASQMFHAMSK